MSKKAQRRAAKGWKNLEKYRPATRPDTIEEAVLHTKGLHLLTGSKTRLFKRQDVVIDGKQYYLHIGLY